MEKQKLELKVAVLTLQENKMSTRPNVYRNHKKYTRKSKHKKSYND